MSFNSVETSVDDGQPIELFKFAFLTNHWCFTTHTEQVAFDGDIYVPIAIRHSEIDQTSDAAKASITISVARDCLVGELFRRQAPPGVVTVTIYSKHLNDGDVTVQWKGRIVNADWVEPWLNLTSENVLSSLQRVGLRRRYGVACPHVLYMVGDGLCNLDKDDWKVVGTVDSIVGLTIHCEELNGSPDGKFAGGFIEWTDEDSGYVDMTMIKASNTAGEIIVMTVPINLSAGALINVYPGCAHTPDACNAFGNSINYGGMPFIPLKNPFDGTTLY